MKIAFSKIRKNLTWGVFILSNVQIILIGLNVFGVVNRGLHSLGGILAALIGLLAAFAAIAARSGGRVIGLSFLLALGIFPGQGFFIHAEGISSEIRGLHPVFGLSLLWLAYYLARLDSSSEKDHLEDN